MTGVFIFPEIVGENMARRHIRQQDTIYCDRGVTWVEDQYIQAIYKYRWWFWKINPRLLPPAWRKEHRKLIIVDGKRRGYGEIRGGLIPLSKYNLPGQGVIHGIHTFVRRHLGFWCKRYEKGYTYITIGTFKFVIEQRTTERGLLVCEVTEIPSGRGVGGFSFSPDFNTVTLQYGPKDYELTLHVIMGYIADSCIYNLAATALTREIKIVG